MRQRKGFAAVCSAVVLEALANTPPPGVDPRLCRYDIKAALLGAAADNLVFELPSIRREDDETL